MVQVADAMVAMQGRGDGLDPGSEPSSRWRRATTTLLVGNLRPVSDVVSGGCEDDRGMDLTSALISRPFVVQTEGMEQPGFALPTGTVTFLLTDVEGSTRLWEERPDEMAAAIALHYDLLSAAISECGGLRPVEQGEGDSVVAVFARVADALRAAADAQCRLQVELPWLTVRMAVHTGEAEPRDDGNYVGRTVIRCARLRACGHGGQVLVSEASASLVAGDLPAGLGLVSLGAARLRDLSRTEVVWQLTHPDLRSTFPVLRSLDAAPHNVPTPLTSLVGREVEQSTVCDLLGKHRLVTLTGSGGSGKTRLAVHVAAAAVDLHPDGTWWVELASAASGPEVAERIAVAAGVFLVPGVDPVGQLVRQWRAGADVLIVVDNAEHLIDAVAAVAQRLLSDSPNLRLLVTSREPLGVPGEVIWRVPSLSIPEAATPARIESLTSFESVRLFIERARNARPNLVIDDRAAPHIASICSRLDGIPLAIELAAARARSLPLDRLAAGLSDAFRLLTGGSRTVLPRQQTLLASIAWSVDALDETERTVFRRLAVFQSRFTLDAAEVVCSDDTTVEPVMVLDVLAHLVDKSLVRFDDEGDTRCSRRCVSSGWTVSATRVSWPRPVTATRSGSPPGASRSDAVSTASSPSHGSPTCPTPWPPSSGATTPTRPPPPRSAPGSAGSARPSARMHHRSGNATGS
jgi:predicted ATPase/class 3 adenylate cyclase